MVRDSSTCDCLFLQKPFAEAKPSNCIGEILESLHARSKIEKRCAAGGRNTGIILLLCCCILLICILRKGHDVNRVRVRLSVNTWRLSPALMSLAKERSWVGNGPNNIVKQICANCQVMNIGGHAWIA